MFFNSLKAILQLLQLLVEEERVKYKGLSKDRDTVSVFHWELTELKNANLITIFSRSMHLKYIFKEDKNKVQKGRVFLFVLFLIK